MAKKRVFMVMMVALLSTVFAAGVFAQVTISGGLALSSIKNMELSGEGNIPIDTEIGIGGNLYADYLLPVGFPLSLGFEIGVDTGKFTIKYASYDYDKDVESVIDYQDTMTVLPLLLRVAYHFDLLANLDLYLVAKIGYAVGFWSGDFYDMLTKNSAITVGDIGGVAFGFDIGAAYYFTPVFGIFAEAGFDDYALESKISGGGWSDTLKAPFNRFLTFGISTKF
ncbi:MAG: hypothetical protein LBK66_00910 [Spirochaetaceae bacterium]|jgi:opacity protein-like surface antigen|nr:hypothetical protein [Spirochaetaceae bacterium]